MNVVVVIPLTNYPKFSDRQKLVQDLRELASTIEAYDRTGIPSYEHLENMTNLIFERFPASIQATHPELADS